MTPEVSIIMPARDVEAFVGEAVQSVLAQSLRNIELLVIDDGSRDSTVAVVQRIADGDPRLRCLSGHGRGPAAARNLGLSAATGHWLAVVDADDAIAPGRLAQLVSEAQTQDVDIVADNLCAFYDDGRPDHPWLQGGFWTEAHEVGLAAFLASGVDGTDRDQPGYLKPVFRRSWLDRTGLRYDENLIIGEDYDFIARALCCGARYWYVPLTGYRYRRHGASTSYRISERQIAEMIDALERLDTGVDGQAQLALERRVRSLELDQQFLVQVEALKSRHWSALSTLVTTQALRRRLSLAVRSGARRRLRATLGI